MLTRKSEEKRKAEATDASSPNASPMVLRDAFSPKVLEILKTKNNRPMKTSQLFVQDNNAALTKLTQERYKLVMENSMKRRARERPPVIPTSNVVKIPSVPEEITTIYDNPLTPMQIAAHRDERWERYKLAIKNSMKQSASESPPVIPTSNVVEISSVPEEITTKYDNPLTLMQIAAYHAEQITRDRSCVSATKNNRPMKTSQLFVQDNNAALTKLTQERYKLVMENSMKRRAREGPPVIPTSKVVKISSVLEEITTIYDNPLTPMQIAAHRAERIAKDRLCVSSFKSGKESTSNTAGRKRKLTKRNVADASKKNSPDPTKMKTRKKVNVERMQEVLMAEMISKEEERSSSEINA